MKLIPTDERTVSDKELFSSLSHSVPQLEGSRNAWLQGNLSRAKKELIRYFETRTNVAYYFDYRSLPLRPIDTDSFPFHFQASLGTDGNLKDFCLYAGRKMMEHIYVRPERERQELHLGPQYENLPHFNFYEDQGKKHRTTLDIFSRGQFFEYLAVLYHETGDSQVLASFQEILDMFLTHYPLVVEDTSPEASHFSFTEERDVMSAGWLCLTYASLLYTRLPYEIPEDTAFEIIKRIWFLGIQFRRFEQDGYKKYNHHMWERGLVPFILGTLFPEFPELAKMQSRGAQVICQHILDDFNQEGGYSEHSISYWGGAALGEMLCRGIELARLNNISLLNEDSYSRIRGSFDILARICPPGKYYPSLGDGGGAEVNNILQAGVLSIDSDSCRQVLESRTQPDPSRVPSLSLDYCSDKTGFFSFKSSFLPNASQVLMSTKRNCGDTGHNHMDLLSLFVTIHGQEFIGEPYARSLYHSAPVSSKLRGYLYNMRSHNVLLAYGAPVQPDSLYASKWGVLRPDTPVTRFVSLSRGCYVSAFHNAYTVCRHTRKLLCCRRNGFLIRDELLGGDRMQKEHIQRWHLMPGVSVRLLGEQGALMEKDGIQAAFFWDGNPRLHLWKNTDLCPSIVKREENLAFILDVCFQTPDFSPAGKIGTVSQSLLVLDVTGQPSLLSRLQDRQRSGELDAVMELLMEEASSGQVESALEQFAMISN